MAQDASYPRLEAPGFGRVIVDGEEWDRDLFIRADGEIKRRKKKPVKALYGTSHVLGPEELEKVCRGEPDHLVIAAGYAGMLHLAPEGEQFLAEKGIVHEVLPTPQAVKRYRELGEGVRKAILVHVTC